MAGAFGGDFGKSGRDPEGGLGVFDVRCGVARVGAGYCSAVLCCAGCFPALHGPLVLHTFIQTAAVVFIPTAALGCNEML